MKAIKEKKCQGSKKGLMCGIVRNDKEEDKTKKI